MPLLFSFLGTVLSICLNVFSIFGILGFFYPLASYINKINVLILIVFVSGFNYFTLYKNKQFEEIFDDFDKNRDLYKKWDISIVSFIVFTILLFLSVLIVADMKNHS